MGDYFERGNRDGGTSNPNSASFVDIINNEYGRLYMQEFQNRNDINTDVTTKEGLVNYLNFISKVVVDVINERNGTCHEPYIFTQESEGVNFLLNATQERPIARWLEMAEIKFYKLYENNEK